MRPRHLIPPDVDEVENLDWSDEGQRCASEHAQAYARRFREQRAFYKLPLATSDAQFAHLVATGCLIYERQVLRNLERTLWPPRSEEAHGKNTPFMVALGFALGEAQYDFIDNRTRFSDLWEREFQHALPTPTGLLIGISVHGVKSGNDLTQEWEWASGKVAYDPVIDTQVWDGDRISQRFLERLDQEIKDRAERHVTPWYGLL